MFLFTVARPLVEKIWILDLLYVSELEVIYQKFGHCVSKIPFRMLTYSRRKVARQIRILNPEFGVLCVLVEIVKSGMPLSPIQLRCLGTCQRVCPTDTLKTPLYTFKYCFKTKWAFLPCPKALELIFLINWIYHKNHLLCLKSILNDTCLKWQFLFFY